MARIKLRLIDEITGREIGNMLVDVESIETVIEYDEPKNVDHCSMITMKPVIDGSDGNGGFKMQSTYHVAQSVNEIEALIENAQ
ncbi:hypothetical protein [Shewanella sp. UCD-KL12]|uniref:hypothetical protein n=1 Tax=Shewanella sp. UCD-KL12 TaxID=1917163 RepID=UPI0009707BDB|nr:hypothetical protein [Shewanella sp. UCD-KL12]